MSNQDFHSLVPQQIVVTFPQTDDGIPSTTKHTEAVTLSSLSLSDHPAVGTFGFDGEKLITTELVATYVSSSQTNAAETQALAQQYASDWYQWRLGQRDVKLCGVVPYTPEGFHDLEWRIEEGQTDEPSSKPLVYTQLSRRAAFDWVDVLNHYGAGGGAKECCPGIWTFNGVTYFVFNITVDNSTWTWTDVTFNIDGGTWTFGDTSNTIIVFGDNSKVTFEGQIGFKKNIVGNVSTQQDDYALSTSANVDVITATSDFDFTGIAAPSPEYNQWYRFFNDGTATITLKHQSASSSANNKLEYPSNTDHKIKTNESWDVIYDTNANHWEVTVFQANDPNCCKTIVGPKTVDYTAVAGEHVLVDVSGGTDVAISLPSTPAIGDSVCVTLVDDHATAEGTLTTSDEVNGTVITNEWVWVIEGDTVDFLYVGDDCEWLAIDHLQPHSGKMSGSTGQTITDTGTGGDQKIAFDTEAFDHGGIVDITASNHWFQVRRDSVYEVSCSATLMSMSDQKWIKLHLYVAGGKVMSVQNSASGTQNVTAVLTTRLDLTDGQQVHFEVEHNEGSNLSLDTGDFVAVASITECRTVT